MDNDRIAEILEEIAVFLELKGENPFKSRAYANAARAVETFEEPLARLAAEGRLGSVRGFGQAMQTKIEELVATGKLKYYEDLKASIPPGLIAMLDIPGLGGKKVKAIHDQLGVETVEDLETACRNDKVAALKGFGAKSQSRILEGIEHRRNYASRHLISDALAQAGPILEALRNHPDVIRCEAAGSLRRHKEVVGDLDFLVSSKNPKEVIECFAGQPQAATVLVQGSTKASVILEDGMQADLRVVDDKEYPFALAYFTGSKEHNIVMRRRAIERGLRLNEYGLFRSKAETRDPSLRVNCETEEAVFEKLDLPYIPPELREDAGEFQAGEKNAIPRLVEWTQLKGSLHNHSNWSDGKGSLEEIARDMMELGCRYWAITDHSKSSFQANGLTADRLKKQLLEIEKLNRRFEEEGSDFRLLTGSEVDIRMDGTLDYDDELLERLEVVVASVHQGFSRSESETTRRMIKAAEHPCVHMMGHLTGRLLLRREPYQVNQKAVIDACAASGTWIELNANPYRFDLDWRLWSYAKSKGVKCAINCDAHRREHAGYLRLGAGIARKGWLTREDVVNTLPLDSLRKALREKRERGA